MSVPFPTTAVLGAATGVLMADFSSLHRLIEHYAQGPVWTHQIPTLGDEIERAAIDTLGDRYEPLDTDVEGWEAYRDRMLDKIGPEIDVPLMGKPFHRADAVMADAIEAMGGDPSRVVQIAPGDAK